MRDPRQRVDLIGLLIAFGMSAREAKRVAALPVRRRIRSRRRP